MGDSTHLDVIVVGAGISGIGAAYHLTDQCPGTSFAIFETQESFGGTWLTHTYPGVRSDSDLFTFGYRFKPWTGAPIASAAEILTYMNEVIDDNDLDQYIRYQHKITKADWSNANNLWTLEVTRLDTGETLQYTTKFLWMCQGYYRHDQGYTPEWDGFDDYKRRNHSPPDLARRCRFDRQESHLHWLWRDSGNTDPRHCRRVRSRHHVAALAYLFPCRSQS